MTEVFPIVPASAKPLWLACVVGVILLLAAALLMYIAWSSRNARVEVGEGQLRLAGDFWGRAIDLDALDLERASVVDLGKTSELAPRLRTWGTAMPGYASGWFRLRNGEKALAYLTRRDAVVYVPTSLGYALLLSAERPRELLATLRTASER